MPSMDPSPAPIPDSEVITKALYMIEVAIAEARAAIRDLEIARQHIEQRDYDGAELHARRASQAMGIARPHAFSASASTFTLKTRAYDEIQTQEKTP